MTTHNLLLLPGDGIGVETMAEVERVIAFFNQEQPGEVRDRQRSGRRLGLRQARRRDHRRGDGQGAEGRRRDVRRRRRAEVGQRPLSSTAPRPACCACARTSTFSPTSAPPSAIPALADASRLKRELVEGLDIMIVRELTGGVYFGEPKEIVTLENGEKRAVDTRSTPRARSSASPRSPSTSRASAATRCISADKRNVMRTGVLWKQVVTASTSPTRRTSSSSTSSPTTAQCS